MGIRGGAVLGWLFVGITAASAAGATAPASRDANEKLGERASQINRALRQLYATPNRSTARKAIDLTERESNPRLKTYAVGALVESKGRLPKSERASVEQLREATFPKTPSLPSRGLIRVAHMIGPEFYRNEIARYKHSGFEVNELSDSRATAKRGRLRVLIRRGDQNIFRDMDDPRVHVVVYSGHSDVGGVVDLSMAKAPEQRGEKLVVVLQCVGTETLPMIKAKYGAAQILTTKHPSFDTEDQNLLHALYHGFERGQTYAQIRERAHLRNKTTNYLMPNESAAAVHLDLDGDGRLDHARGRASNPRFDLVGTADRHAGSKLVMAVGFSNSTHRYYAEDVKNAALDSETVKGRFVSGGLVHETHTGSVTDIRVRHIDGKTVSEVRLNDQYARDPKWFVEAASVYEMHLHLIRSTHGAATRRDKLRAAIFAGDYLLRFAPFRDQSTVAMDRLAKLHHIGGLTYDKIEPVLLSDSHATGTNEQLDALAAALRR